MGAGSVLYGNKIVLFREETVGFASDFKALGYSTFEKNKLDAKESTLLNELQMLGIMKFRPAWAERPPTEFRQPVDSCSPTVSG